jgi:hypothetical protein
MTPGKARNDAMTRGDTTSIEAISHARARARTRYQNPPRDTSSRVSAPSDHPPRDRHARYRARVKDGKAIYAVELGGEGVDFLIKTGWLVESEACDRDAVGAALTRMVADAARR